MPLMVSAADQLPQAVKDAKQKVSKEKQISVDELKELLKKEKHEVIVDLRSHQERVDFGYIQSAINLDCLSASFEAQFQEKFPDKNTPIILMCAVGGRASMAYADLTELGYTNLKTVKGSFNAYKASGGEIQPGKKK